MSYEDNQDNYVAQCRYILAKGNYCGAPALKAGFYCRHHAARPSTPAAQTVDINFSELTNPQSIQKAIADVMQANVSGLLTPRHSSSLIYGLRVAMSNLKNVAVEPQEHGANDLAQLLLETLDQLNADVEAAEQAKKEKAQRAAMEHNLCPTQESSFD